MKRRGQGDGQSIAELPAPSLAALAVRGWFRTLAKLDGLTPEGQQHALDRSRTLLRRFDVDWEPGPADQADADRLVGRAAS